jgi:very-short-patch-repair endonuclease
VRLERGDPVVVAGRSTRTNLTVRPFTLDEGLAAGLTPSALSRRPWIRIGSRLYCFESARGDPWQVLFALQQLLPSDAAFAGPTAAWMHGLDFKATDPVEVVTPPGSVSRSRLGLRVRRCGLPPSDVTLIRGLRVTSIHRTLRDLCLRLPPVEGLVALDMALARRRTHATALRSYVESTKGLPGTRRMRSLVALAAPADSPMETRLRWLLLEHGLPAPEVQVDLHDPDGRFVGRADLYYAETRLVIEFDGGIHRDKLVDDDQRQNALVSAGYVVLRFTSVDVYQRPLAVEALVREAIGRKVARLRPRSLNFGGKVAD